MHATTVDGVPEVAEVAGGPGRPVARGRHPGARSAASWGAVSGLGTGGAHVATAHRFGIGVGGTSGGGVGRARPGAERGRAAVEAAGADGGLAGLRSVAD